VGDTYVLPEWSHKDSALVPHLDVGASKSSNMKDPSRQLSFRLA